MWYVLLLLVGSSGQPAMPVDKIELNHTPNYSQVILWRYAAGWWLVSENDIEHAPTKRGERWIARDKNGKLYVSHTYSESYTRYDPERLNARFFAEGLRCFR